MIASIDRVAQLVTAAFLLPLVLSTPAPQSDSETEESASAVYSSSSYGRCRGGTRKVPRLATFDDIPYTDFPRTQVPTPYQSLNMSTFFIEQNNGFLISQSGTQYAISYDSTLPREFSIPSSSPGTRTSDGIQSFDLKSFYYGCSQGVPQPECYVRVTGFRARHSSTKPNQQTEISLQVSYPRLEPPVDPASLTLAKVSFDATDAWEELEKVRVDVSYDVEGTQPAVFAGFVVDNLEFVVNECRRGY